MHSTNRQGSGVWFLILGCLKMSNSFFQSHLLGLWNSYCTTSYNCTPIPLCHFCFVFNITHYGWFSLQMNCLSFAVWKYISLLFVFTLRFCRRYILFTSNESTQNSHSTSLMEAVVSCIVPSCLRNTPWCRVDIFLTPDTWAASALTVTSCYAAAWFIDEMAIIPLAVKVSQ